MMCSPRCRLRCACHLVLSWQIRLTDALASNMQLSEPLYTPRSTLISYLTQQAQDQGGHGSHSWPRADEFKRSLRAFFGDATADKLKHIARMALEDHDKVGAVGR